MAFSKEIPSGPAEIDAAFQSRLAAALQRARSALLNERNEQGHWRGELSSSALSTATAICALSVSQNPDPGFDLAIKSGLGWLTRNANADGGWGDTIRSKSNISTTTLCWAVLRLHSESIAELREPAKRAEAWLARAAGGADPDSLTEAILARYGTDRTFSVPILTLCAIAGRLGGGRAAWDRIIPLPFELAIFPPEWFAALRLPVVSYALPALIAMGIARHRNAPSRNPFARGIRNFSEPRAVRVLTRIQPENGGFLEATPLTSFVVMSLAASDYSDHPVARKGIAFLRQAQREDGSWPIDTDLATWLSTMSVSALGTNITDSGGRLRDWLLNQQYRVLHPYTNAAPGGWAWTDLPGGVPDADDTAGALLALHSLGSDHAESLAAAKLGIDWLLSLQNRDGGIPTFCRGWGKLPFDHSSADITAHALRAWSAWMPRLDSTTQARVKAAARKAIRFLIREQQSSGPAAGAWAPLWFGNEHNPDEINWTYGTARVLLALAPAADSFHIHPQVLNAAGWLIKTQNADGGWGGGSPNTESSVEETGLAVESLAEFLQNDTEELKSKALTAALRGAEWLITRIEDGSWTTAAPIGFYFAKLWYYERLYPMIMTTAALQNLEGITKLNLG